MSRKENNATSDPPSTGRDGLSTAVFVIVLACLALGGLWMAQTIHKYNSAFGDHGAQWEELRRLPLTSSALVEAQKEAKAEWGQYGDYLGGVLNPILAFLSFGALAITLILQTKQVQLSRTELAEARQAQVEASEMQTKQLQASKSLANAQYDAAYALEQAANSQYDSAQTLQKQLEVAEEAAAAQQSFMRRQVELAEAAAAAQQRTADAQEEAASALSHQAEVASALAQLNAAVAMSHMYDQAINELIARYAPGAPSSDAESHLAKLRQACDEARNTAQQCRADIEKLRKAATASRRRV